MAKLTINISVDDNDIPDRIRRGIKDGMRDAGEELLDSGENTAKNTIQKRGRVWRRELMNSFERENEGTGKGRRAILRNVATHAAPVEYGATYTTRGPPVEALIPWVLSKWNPGAGDTWDDSDGPDSPSAAARSKGFSPKQKLQNQNAQKNYPLIADDAWTQVTDKEVDDIGRLTRSSATDVQDALEAHSELNSDYISEVFDDISRWKLQSEPGNERIDRYAEATRRLFNIDGEARGHHVGDIELDYADALKTWSEISKIHMHEQFGDEHGNMDVVRGLRRDTGALAQEMFDNPTADEWSIDVGAVYNYTTDRNIAEVFDQGLIGERTISIDDELIMAPDWVLSHDIKRGEYELHLRGGSGITFPSDRVYITRWEMQQGGRIKIQQPFPEVRDEFSAGNFESFTDDELHGFTELVKRIGLIDGTVSTPGGQQRVINLRDEYIARGLHETKGYTQDEMQQIFNRII